MFTSLQTCRAIAAFLVLAFHAGANLAKDKYFGDSADYLAELLSFGGAAGVAFFFVLSGFIISHVHHGDLGKPERLPSYLLKRAIRIYPTYLIIFLGVYGLALLTPSLRNTMPVDPWVLLKSLLLLPQDKLEVGGTGAPVLVVAWTLQFEMLFYLAYALGILHRAALWGAALLFMAAWIFLPPEPQRIFPVSFISSHMIFLFMLGMATHYVHARSPAGHRPLPLAIAAASFFAAICVTDILVPGYSAEFNLAYGLASALVVWSLLSCEKTGRAPRNRWLLASGEASYALYLLHFPMIAVLSKIMVLVLPLNAIGAAIAFVLMLVTCITASLAFHYRVERPLLQFLLPARKRKAIAGSAAERKL